MIKRFVLAKKMSWIKKIYKSTDEVKAKYTIKLNKNKNEKENENKEKKRRKRKHAYTNTS